MTDVVEHPDREGGLPPGEAPSIGEVHDGAPQRIEARPLRLGGGIGVRRTLPTRARSNVGAWCFLDEMGPVDLRTGTGMDVPPHPHIGLQTVTWLTEGELLHRDSLGTEQHIRPGQLNLMTSGRGIAHSEESPPGAPERLHGVQLWTVLPAAHAGTDPAFQHVADPPVVEHGDARITVFVGSLGPAHSPATTFSPLVGAEIRFDGAGTTGPELDPGHEHAVMVLDGRATVDGDELAPGTMLYLGSGCTTLPVSTDGAARLLLIGGAPFEEPLVMWWNFVAGDADAIVAARDDWVAGRRFGAVEGYDGPPVPAPPLPTGRLQPRG